MIILLLLVLVIKLFIILLLLLVLFKRIFLRVKDLFFFNLKKFLVELLVVGVFRKIGGVVLFII